MAKEREVNIIVDAKNKSKSAFLEVKRDLNEIGNTANKNLDKFSGSLSKADKFIYSFSDRLKVLDKVAKRTFQGTAAAASIYVATTLRDFSQLEDGISKVNTLYDYSTKSREKMIKDSIQMYRMIPTDFEKITQGIYDTISAGGSPEYASMYARKFGMASVAGMTDIPIVVKAAMGTMNAFKKEIKDLNHILDVQFLTVKNGIVEYGELASALGTGVLKSAESAGVSMEELYAAIAAITKNAIPANVATTSLIQMLNKFTDSKVIKELKEYGVHIRNVKGETRPLIEIMKDLNEQFDKRNMNKEARATFLKELLGSDEAVRALQPLLGDMKEFNRILGEMKTSSGAMQDAFEARLDNINTQMKLIWNNIKAAGIEQLYTLKPFLDSVTGPLMERQKLEFKKMDLEDALKIEKNPINRQLILEEIQNIEMQIGQIDLTPVEQFRDALAESVKQLEKINPPLAAFLNSIGNFAIDMLGEEGKENRESLTKWANRIFWIWIVSKGTRIFKDIFGIGIGQFIGKAGPKTYNWLKNSEVAKWIGKEALAPTMLGTGLIYGAFKTSEALEKYDPTVKERKEISGRTNHQKLEDFANKYLYSGKFNAEEWKIISDTVMAIGADKSIKEEVMKAYVDTLVQRMEGNYKQGKSSLIDYDKENEILQDKLIEIFMQIQKQMEKNVSNQKDVSKETPFSNNLLKIMDEAKAIERQINLQNSISIQPPKVNIYIDGKNANQNIKKVEYDDVEKYMLRESRRYGRW